MAAMTTNVFTPSPSGGVVMAPVGTDPRGRYKLFLYRLGIAETVLGSLSCLLCVASIIACTSACYWYGDLTYVATGLWCGVFAIISGGLGICARNQPSVCMYNANMVMTIIASVMMGIQLIMSSIAAASTSYIPGLAAVHVALALLGFSAMVICIVHSAYCCAGVCCRKKYPQQSVMYSAQPTQQFAAPPTQQFVQLANGQYMLVQSQPVMPQAYPAYPSFPTGIPNTSLPANPQAYPTPASSAPVAQPQSYPPLQGGITGATMTSQPLLANPDTSATPQNVDPGHPAGTKPQEPNYPPAYSA